MTPDDEFRELSAAYVLSALPAEDRRRFEDHLEGCPRCREEVLAFTPIPALLARVDLDQLDGAAAPDRAAAIVAAARSELGQLRTSRRRRRLATVATAAAAVLALVLGLAVVTRDDRAGDPPGVALRLSSAVGVDGAVIADERPWGTYVHVALSDLPPRDTYELWVVSRDGAWHPVGSWRPTAEARANLGSSTGLRLPEIDRLVITSADRDDQLATAA